MSADDLPVPSEAAARAYFAALLDAYLDAHPDVAALSEPPSVEARATA